jgi:hypothetical protein
MGCVRALTLKYRPRLDEWVALPKEGEQLPEGVYVLLEPPRPHELREGIAYGHEALFDD